VYRRAGFLVLGVFFLAALCLSMPCAVMAEGPIVLNYANFPPAPTFPCVQMEEWKKKVEKRTNGKVLIQTYPGGTLLKAKGMMDGVIAGTADIGCLCMAYQPGRFPITNAISLPLGLPNSRVASLVLWELYKKYKPASFARVKVLTMFTTAPSNIMSRIPIRTLEDIKGVPLRASGGAAQILKAWGANRVGMPMPETPEALQKGVVKGLFSSLEVLKDMKFAELCKYVTLTNTAVYPFAVVMNMDSWNRLPEDVRQVMDELAREQCIWTGTYMDNHVKESVVWSQKTQGVEIIELSKEEKTRWDKLLQPIVTQWIKDMSAKGIPAAQIVDDIKSMMKSYN
jgi:TRAP-type C4-dicarboxylate transport system substrate-binding protein